MAGGRRSYSAFSPSLMFRDERKMRDMNDKFKEITQKILLGEIYKAERMVAYTMEFEDKTAAGRWKMTVFQLKCLYKKLDTAFKLIQEGASDEKVADLLDMLDKQLFMEGP